MWFESITGGRWLARAFQKRCPPLSDRVTLQAPWQQIFWPVAPSGPEGRCKTQVENPDIDLLWGLCRFQASHANSKFLDNFAKNLWFSILLFLQYFFLQMTLFQLA